MILTKSQAFTKLTYLFNSTSQPQKVMTQIIEKNKINHDCYIYKLRFLKESFQLGIGQHFKITKFLKTYDFPEGEQVSRKYTPINLTSQKDCLDLLLKIYRPNQNIKYPQGGKLTPYLETLQVGEKLQIEGPLGKFEYCGKGNFILNGESKKFNRIFFIAGGSGITPCYQVINEINQMKDENIEMILLFANKTYEDIVLKKQLQKFQPRIKLYYSLDVAPTDWNGFTGRISHEMLSAICPLNDVNTLYIHCGPFGFNKWCREYFKKNYLGSTLFKF